MARACSYIPISAWACLWEKDSPTPEDLESRGQNICFKTPLLIRATKQSRSFSLCLEAVFSFLVSQGKERARDLRIVCENLGKSLVSQRTDISSYLTKVFWLSARYFFSLVTVLHLQFNCQYQLCQPKQPGPQCHLENTQAFQVFSKSPVREMLLIINGHWFFSTLGNLSPTSHAEPRKSATSYSGWVISKGSSTFIEHTRKMTGSLGLKEPYFSYWEARFCSSVGNYFHWLHELNDTARLLLYFDPNVSEWMNDVLSKNICNELHAENLAESSLTDPSSSL